jgi:phospholipid/cholesterol/gamma-HCH transport system substrate-binding protein
MINHKKDIMISVLLVIGFCLLCIAIWGPTYIGLNTSSAQTYTILAKFSQIGSLRMNSKITISGVPIGVVSNIVLDPDTHNAQVTMQIESEVNFITTDSIAAIVSTNLVGKHYIDISLGASTHLLQDGQFLEQTKDAILFADILGKVFLRKILLQQRN